MMINLVGMEKSAILRLGCGATAEVVENIGDGEWVSVRYLTSNDTSIIGREELCHASDIVGVDEPH
jgi:hypothetical protein